MSVGLECLECGNLHEWYCHSFHDSALLQTVAAKVLKLATAANMNILSHPSYSQDRSTYNHFLFTTMKSRLRKDGQEVEAASRTALGGVPENLAQKSIFRSENFCIDVEGAIMKDSVKNVKKLDLCVKFCK
ncbi:hypothetical protein ElyMa_006986100 [Elysia marginata]|uniref:Uncharacterized protein n=1 Tax=Elysia marginata TaxID=1093978 RepID=A0AAV4JN74_9GAST|nr:hypothetical protein ElyMa_006986100 [Elysia marginata]